LYVEDLKRGANKGIELKDIFEMGSNNRLAGSRPNLTGFFAALFLITDFTSEQFGGTI
jgi:hypothetical protein